MLLSLVGEFLPYPGTTPYRHQHSDETLKSRGLLHTANDKKEEAKSLEQQITALRQQASTLESELKELEAITFTEDQVMAQSMTDYQETLKAYQVMCDREKTLKDERDQAVTALNEANAKLDRAQSKKKKCLSLSEVSTASEEEGNAKRKVDELEALLKNLDDVLSALPGKLSEKHNELNNAESAVWKAKCAVLLCAVQELPQFAQIVDGLQAAFAAWTKAGRSWHPEGFFNTAFLVKGQLDLDPDQIRARQAELSQELGLKTV